MLFTISSEPVSTDVHDILRDFTNVTFVFDDGLPEAHKIVFDPACPISGQAVRVMVWLELESWSTRLNCSLGVITCGVSLV